MEQWRELQIVEVEVNEKYGGKKNRGKLTHCSSYKCAADALDPSATWCLPPLIYNLNNAAVETQPAW